MSYTAQKEGNTIAIRLEGKKLKDMFSEGALAIFHALYDTDAIRGNERIKLVVQAKNLSDLFHAWISDLFERADIQGIACGEFRVASIQKISNSQYLLTGVAYGEPYDASKHGSVKVKKISKTEVTGGKTGEICTCEATITLA